MAEKDLNAILEQMTLEEKASLCSGLTFWLTKPIDRLGVPSVWMADGPHGMRKEKQTGGTNIMQESETATCFPPAATAANSWDDALLEEAGDAIGKEAKASDVTTVLGPGINIKRSPLCGRNFEYFSEDPYLTGRLGAAWVRGVQKNGIGTSLKHYCANNQEHLRMSIDSVVDERALREIYLAAFEHIVKTEQPSTVMCSYNRVDGEYLSDNKRLLNDVLRDEWGFEGLVVSDWGAVNDRVAGIRAGMDLEMPGNKGMNDRVIVKAVQSGELDEADLDKVVLRALKFAFDCKAAETGGVTDFEAHHSLARKIAADSAVLLKNEDKALPLKSAKNIAVVGALAKKLRYQGSGSSFINTYKTVSFTQAMSQKGHAFTYAPGYTLKADGYNEELLDAACEAARGKDAVLVFVGLTDAYESEGFDRSHMHMPESHNVLIHRLAKVNDNVIVVMAGGSPVVIDTWDEKVKAVLHTYLGGQAGGEAAYDLIFGAVNPSGKLAETYPIANEDNIAAAYFPQGPRSVEYRESVFVGYRYFDTAQKDVKYPFGYGLSYTQFEYSDLKLSAEKIKQGQGGLTVSFRIKNIGDRAGAEIAQLYVSDVESKIFRPLKELKGYTKVFLEAGRSKQVTLTLDDRAFSYYNTAINDWHIESGDFKILVGASSRDIKLEETVRVLSAKPRSRVPDYRESAPYYYQLAEEGIDPAQIPADQFAALYGSPLPNNDVYEKGSFTINNSVQQVSSSATGKVIYGALSIGSHIVALSAENPEMIKNAVKDLPLRSFSNFTGGLIPPASVDGLLDMCNGKKGGFKKVIQGFKKENK
ncbi:MAG: glycosyl hydrolase [Clostridiales bacterium]|nr:glycosyl hydrolase [Clostridiales bacterium]